MIIDSPIISGSQSFSGSLNQLGNITVTGSLTVSSSNATQLQVGSNLLFVSSSGRVGIGTTNPQFPLSFGSTLGNKIALYDAGAANTQYGFGIQSSLLQIFANTVTDRVGIGYGNSTSFTETLSIKGLNVGIGTTNPAAKLDISGSTLITGSLTVITGSGVEFQVTDTGTKIGNIISDTHNVTGSLNVSGSITTPGTITAQTLFVQVITSSTDFVTGSTRFGSKSTDTMQVTGSISTTGSLVDINKDGQSLRIFPQTSSGSARIQLQNSGSAGLAGANAIIAVESVAGGDQFSGTSPFSLAIGTATQKAFHLCANSVAIMTITGSSVGIGTTTPDLGAALSVNKTGAGLQDTVYLTNLQSAAADTGVNLWFLGGPSLNSLGRIAAGWTGATTTTSYMSFYTRGDGSTTEKVRITSSGSVGIGTTNPSLATLQISGSDTGFRIQATSRAQMVLQTASGSWQIESPFGTSNVQSGSLGIIEGGVGTRLTIQRNTGNVGIGVTSPTFRLQVSTGASGNVASFSDGVAQTMVFSTDASTYYLNASNGGNIQFQQAGNNTMRITSGGNALIGTTDNTAAYRLNVAVNGGSAYMGVTNQAGGTGDRYLRIGFGTGATVASIQGTRVNVADDVNLALQPDGADVYIGKSTADDTITGISLEPQDAEAYNFTQGASSGGWVIMCNRHVSDGDLITFRQANTTEGSISVSGTTVSYNGGHLARWSQTITNERVENLYKGTVMSNLDKMAEWINPETGEPYPNEQLNCMKVSDVEGDPNVAGVFVNWDNDDNVFTNDMNVAMTGDMIIRIAQGVTVQRGDLLISAGDGTAKPQSDDIRRSNTIAKVTSNHVTCTYEDGSYCVPCVLMAC